MVKQVKTIDLWFHKNDYGWLTIEGDTVTYEDTHGTREVHENVAVDEVVAEYQNWARNYGKGLVP